MEKQYKPVPDTEPLRYKGTPDKPDIKIFVSHRIDLDSETIDNPLYIPVRCGAVYDEREGVTMLGDDTGDNISEKRNSFCELTVQYWAWKNVEADYYGLCHYRRFLSFSDKTYPVSNTDNKSGLVVANSIEEAKKSFNLESETIARKTIENCDVTALTPFDERTAYSSSIYEMFCLDFMHFDKRVVDKMMDIIQEKHPEIYPYAQEYMKKPYARLFNLFVAKKEIFFSFCDFEFSVLFELEKAVDLSNESSVRQRQIGYYGEHLWAIYVLYLQDKKDVKISDLQGVFCEHVKPMDYIKPAFPQNNIAVVFASSETFAPYLGVAIKSLIDSSDDKYNYDIVILEKNISDYQKRRVESIVKGKENFSLRFSNVSHMVRKIKFFLANNAELSEETYYTVLVPWILKNYRKALVLDCDIIIKKDVADLFNIDMEDSYIAAAKEIIYLGYLNNPLINIDNSLMEYTTKILGLKNPFNYFQGGVLLMDLVKFRENFEMEDLLNDINTHNYNIVEQDLLNRICREHVKILPYNWNFMACISTATVPNLNLAPKVEKEKYDEAAKNPYIYHYITGMKPWRYPNMEYAEEWWNAARNTIFYEIALSDLRINAVPVLENAIFDLQKAAGFFDHRSGARKMADKYFPEGSIRRSVLEFLAPWGSKRREFCKKIYNFLRSQ